MKRWRFAVLALVGIGVLAGAYFYKAFWLSKPPVGSGPAGPTVANEPFAEAWTDRNVLLLGLGDSVTAGFGVPAAYSYFSRLVANPDDEFPEMRGICLSAVLPNLTSRNMSVSCSTSIDHLRHLTDSLEEQPADVFGLVVMTSGGNDLIHDYGRSPPREGAMYGATFQQAQPWIAAFENRLGQMIDLIESRFPGGCKIFLADIYDPTDGVGDAQNAGLARWPDGVPIHRAYNDVIGRVAADRESVVLVPMYDAFLGHGIHCTHSWRQFYRPDDPHYWYAWNLEDPNTRGYDAIRRLFLIEMARVARELADRVGPIQAESNLTAE